MVIDSLGGLRASGEGMPGDGAMVELHDADENLFINVKY